MTAAATSNLPFQTGGVVAAALGRGVLWAIGQYMRQPLRNTALAGMVGLSALAGSNALYFQHRHPSPLFGVVEQQVATTQATPAVPASRPKTLKLATTDKTTTGSVDATAPVPKPIGNDEVLKLQRKLLELQLFEGKVDGLYGPRTARSIKAFEEQHGLTPKGELTREIIELILSAPVLAPASKTEAAVTLAPVPATKTAAKPEPVPDTTALAAEPLPAPAPLAADVSPVTTLALKTEAAPLTRDYPETPDEAMALVADTAGDAIDTILDGVQAMSQTKPSTVTKRIVQTVPVKALGAVASLQPLPDPLPAATVPATPVPAATDHELVSQVQRGLSSLGFLHTAIDGVAGEATAKAIRNFEVYYNYDVTGRVTPELVKLLVENGAVI